MEMEPGRILNRNLFLYLLDLEIKRARRYQNFLSILSLELISSANGGGGDDLQTSHEMLANFLTDEMRETDISGSIGEKVIVVLLPYADHSDGNHAKARFERSLKFYDFRSRGYDVAIHQTSFPADGTNTAEIMRRALGPEAQAPIQSPGGNHPAVDPCPGESR